MSKASAVLETFLEEYEKATPERKRKFKITYSIFKKLKTLYSTKLK
ncbi:MAG: hypothetical protein ACFFC7_29725 [Candidatus Hermodarchaeota archaeon]